LIELKIKFDKKDLMDLRKMPDQFRSGLLKGMRKSLFFAERMSKKDFEKSRGPAGGLKARTGNLRRKIESGVNVKGNNIIGWIGSNLIYAQIHELGGIIKPRTKQYLRFQIEGFWKTVKQVIIPQRPFIEPGITENIDKIKNIIQNSIVKEVN
jgi:phage gpG-like protein